MTSLGVAKPRRITAHLLLWWGRLCGLSAAVPANWIHCPHGNSTVDQTAVEVDAHSTAASAPRHKFTTPSGRAAALVQPRPDLAVCVSALLLPGS